jgi:hypothetical protein
MLRDGLSQGTLDDGLVELLKKFEQEAESAGGWLAYLARMETSIR